eukprot:8879244-Alexandrium_andersonii.AAC.1
MGEATQRASCKASRLRCRHKAGEPSSTRAEHGCPRARLCTVCGHVRSECAGTLHAAIADTTA